MVFVPRQVKNNSSIVGTLHNLLLRRKETIKTSSKKQAQNITHSMQDAENERRVPVHARLHFQSILSALTGKLRKPRRSLESHRPKLILRVYSKIALH